MFFEGNLFWFLMGMLAILVGVGFKAFADDRKWRSQLVEMAAGDCLVPYLQL